MAYLQFDDVSLGYKVGALGTLSTCVLDNLSFAVHPSEILVITGRNGSGKTTLIRTAVGVRGHTSGTVRLTGAVSARRPRVAYLPQFPSPLTWRRAIDDATVLLEVLGVPKRDREGQAERLMRRFDFDAPATRRIHQLSGGQRQKVALVRCLCAAEYVDLIALDEPTNFLDQASRRTLLQELPGFLRSVQCPVLVATHDEELVRILDSPQLLLPSGTLQASS